LRVDIVVAAQPRASRGKNEARRLRVSGSIPGVIYGSAKDPVAVAVSPKDVTKVLRTKSGHNTIFDVEVAGGERTPVIVADEQYDPITSRLIHVDFRRIDLTRKLRVAIPVHVSGEAKGVKQQGGILDVVTRAVEIECIPDDIPTEFALDVTELTVGHAIRVSDLPLKSGVKVLTPADAVIVHITGVKEEAAASTATEPEATGKKGKAAPAAKAAAPAAPAKKK
jgi:large subunit ribosomal protein L25